MDEKIDEQQPSHEIPLHVREIRLPDGRYMIFFTFGDEEPEADV